MDLDSNNSLNNNWAFGFSFLTIPPYRLKLLENGTRFLGRKIA